MSRILIVDDEESIRSLLCDVLGSNGHSCDAVGSGPEAIDKLSVENYDLVLMDQNMPMMTGAQAIVRLRTNPKFRDLPILMCTSRPPAVDPGASGYITKPIDLQALVGIVARAIGGRAAK